MAITIVIPIYADWASLEDCLDSLFEHVDFEKHRLLLVNDSGPQADELEENITAKIHGRKNVQYERNPKNLGFVMTCNRAALELDKTSNDILLLNSDTVVTKGVIEELGSVLAADDKIAVVTPRSNNATLATVPLSSARQKGVDRETAYEIFQKLSKKMPRTVEVPTGHGFCMLIRRKLIKKYGLFDEVFGKGYGEENDFSQRMIREGYKNVLANRAFVFHLEARSFTSEAKAKILETNLKILYDRYPTYRDQVREYMVRETKFESDLERKLGITYYLDNTENSSTSPKPQRILRKIIRLRKITR